MKSAPDELQGWKEIASYLGKSVRAAQRWEAEMDLPVHRIRTPAGQIVFARREEIDAWRNRLEVTPDAPAHHQPPPQTDVPIGVSKRRFYRRGLALAGTLVIMTGVAITVHRASASTPSDFVLTGDSLVARDPSGRTVWTHRFEHPLRTIAPVEMRHLLSQVLHADVDGDGRPEVLAVTIFASDTGIKSDVLWCFSESGDLLWSYEPALTLAFNAGTYTGAWNINDVTFSPAPGPQRIWVAVSHVPWWPSAVVELDRHGKSRPVFVQSGAVYAVVLASWANRPALVTGGVNNEYASAALAILDPDGSASSPQTSGSPFECRGCPKGRPLKYMLFPRSELNVVTKEPYNRVQSIDRGPAGDILLQVRETDDSTQHVVYDLLPNGVIKAWPSDSYWSAHAQLSRAGAVAHSPAHCPDRLTERVVRVWTPGEGWFRVREQPHPATLPGVAQ